MKVLLVNDEKSIQEVFSVMLAETGCEIEPAFDGDEALRLCCERGRLYDLVLTDVRHPGLDGIELAKRIHEKNPAQAIAIVSAVGDDLAQFVRCYLNFPFLAVLFNRQQLVRLVESAANPQHRILMVASDPAVQPLTAAYTSFEIDLEFNGDHALRRYREHGFYDLVLTGYRNPGMNGIDLATAVCKANPAQRIVMITDEWSVTKIPLQGSPHKLPVLRSEDLVKVMTKRGKAVMAKLKRLRGSRMRDKSVDPVSMGFYQFTNDGARGLIDLVNAAFAVQKNKKIAKKSVRTRSA